MKLVRNMFINWIETVIEMSHIMDRPEEENLMLKRIGFIIYVKLCGLDKMNALEQNSITGILFRS